MNKIAIVGCGRLGLSFALLCEQAGYHVWGCDVRENYVNELNRKGLKTAEPQIEYLLGVSKNFTATTDINKAIYHADLIFIFVPTPSKENGEYDHTHIEEVIDGILDYDYDSIVGKTLVIGCTTMPSYCQRLQDKLSRFQVSVVYNAEFIAQGSVVHNLETADFVLLGADKQTDLTEVKEVYHRIMKTHPDFKVMSLTAAEITKMGVNCFLTSKISFANMIAEIAINSGEEDQVKNILSTIGTDSRIGNKYLNYGFGYGGLCLPRDNRALGIHAKKVGVDSDMPQAVDEFNENHLEFLKQQFIEKNPDRDVPFIFNQLGYKKGVDILTESQHYKLCMIFLEEGYKVIIAESNLIIELVKPHLAKYDGQVTYGHNSTSMFPERIIEGQKKIGYVIDL